MKKVIFISILLAASAHAQVSAPSTQSRVAGRFVAYNYGTWSLPAYTMPSGTGSKTFTLSNSTVTMTDGRRFMPFNTNAQVYVGTELVTVTAVGAGCIINSGIIGGCAVTATFAQSHTTADQISSGTFGLQEALNDAGSSGGGAVTIDSAWVALGGTTGIKNGATLPSNTAIEDVRTGTGGGSSLPTATYKGQIATSTAAGSNYAAIGPSAINIRTMFSAVGDGTTDNSTAFANASAAYNTGTVGEHPALYLDCDAGVATCAYKYGGSGTSPLYLALPGTLACAPGVTLNYTGTAHAVDLGPGTGVFTTDITMPYTVQNCTFTGGATYSQGIEIASYTINSVIIGNTFWNFGNRTGYNIHYAGNNWESLVAGNSWSDTDDTSRNILDAHGTNVNALRITNNTVECGGVGGPCPYASMGVGFWISGNTKLDFNVIQFHLPLVRLASTSSANGSSPIITGNHFEQNSGDPTPSITYGDPGGTGGVQLSCQLFQGNFFYVNPASGVPVMGPETPASSVYYLSGCPFRDNQFGGAISSAPYINTNGGNNNIWGRNRSGGAVITAGSTPAPFDSLSPNSFEALADSAYAYSGTLAQFGADELTIYTADINAIATTVVCNDLSGSGTTQACNTALNLTVPSSGACVMYKTTTTNTGALTANINGSGAVAVKKRQGTTALAAGDLLANHQTLMCYDGTEWNLYDPVVP